MLDARRVIVLAAAAGLLSGSAPAGARQAGTAAQNPASEPADRERIDALLKKADELVGVGRGGAKAAEALRLLEPLLLEPLAAEPALGGELHYWIGTAYFRSTKYAEAFDHYQRALEAERAAQDRGGEARTLRMVAQLYKSRGAYLEGLAACEQALAIDRATGNAREAALAAVARGAIRDLMGDHLGALQSYEEALPTLGAETSHDAANLFNEIAISQKNLGNYREALSDYERALRQQVLLKETAAQVFTLLNLGVLYSTLGEDQRAVGYEQEALKLARAVGDRRAESLLLGNLGEMYWDLGQAERATEMLQQELGLAREQGARSEENVALKGLGDVHASRGDLGRAREEYGQALRIQREIGAQAYEASTLVALSDVALREGDASAALDLAQQALSRARETARPELEWNARRALAHAEAASGRTGPAIDELRTSARIINDLRANVAGDTSKIAFVDHRQEVFQDLATLLVDARRPEEALEAAEAGRARAFADLLGQRQVHGKPGEREALSAVRQAQADLRRARAGAGQATPAEAPVATTRAGARLDSSLSTLASGHRELAGLVTAQSPTIPEIVESARRLDASLVEYLVTERQLLAWVVTPAGAVHALKVDVTRERLAALTRSVRTALATAGQAGFRRSPALGSALRELDRLLVAPLAAWLPSSPAASLVVIPHGPLALVPFAALEDDSGRPLVERYTLSFAPAASVYQHTGDKLRAGTAGKRRALIVADPVPPPESGVERLPWAREEGRRVAERLRGTSVRILSGPDASEAAVKREAGGYSLLHFATHGLIAPDRPLASSLLLGAGGGDDGYLRADEVFDLDLSAELVVLSGCSTGLGQLTGDGIIGLTRAFIYAGTPSVVVSQWDVSDRATALLMDRFYAALQQGEPKGAALRAAQLATRRGFAHPALWAAFMLVGEPR